MLVATARSGQGASRPPYPAAGRGNGPRRRSRLSGRGCSVVSPIRSHKRRERVLSLWTFATNHSGEGHRVRRHRLGESQPGHQRRVARSRAVRLGSSAPRHPRSTGGTVFHQCPASEHGNQPRPSRLRHARAEGVGPISRFGWYLGSRLAGSRFEPLSRRQVPIQACTESAQGSPGQP